MIDNAANNFNILVTSSNFQQNYFDNPRELFSDSKILNTLHVLTLKKIDTSL